MASAAPCLKPAFQSDLPEEPEVAVLTASATAPAAAKPRFSALVSRPTAKPPAFGGATLVFQSGECYDDEKEIQDFILNFNQLQE